MEQQDPGYFEKAETMLRQYIGDRMLLFKLQASEKSARLTAVLVIGLILLMLGFFLLLFISIMAGYYFAELTGSLFYGFGIVTAFYLLVMIIILLVRKKHLQPYITNMVIRNIFDKSTDDENITKDQSN
ncbi:phage holin family protein [Flavihumibacter fluvii]|uniref:phage holin family protein n=1 Tax=Flavihumibacter fluvii TaxID=2838157 RepID=UPI001BDF02A2|nr:phage holin family protein [Flavihumibacter fluvii]ULQ52616.1 phage holin family protein [Flavihumibacter fluvii]